MDELKKNKDGTWTIPKSLLKDSGGRYITQGLFLEHAYNTDMAVFTFDDNDKVYQGKTYPSLKKLYLMHEDPVEIDFANTYLCSWDQWKRMLDNKIIRIHIDKWRDELELQIRSYAIKNVIDSLATKDNFQAAKWLASRGWEIRGAGRPSKDEIEANTAKNAKLNELFAEDVARLEDYKKSNK